MTEFWSSALTPQVESRRSCRDNSCYRPHTHDRFSIGLIDSGTTVFSGAETDPLRLGPGDTILVPAGHVHSCNPDDGTWRYQMIHADQDWIATLLPARGTLLFSGIKVFRDQEIHAGFTAANELLFTGAAPPQSEAAFRRALGPCLAREPIHHLAAGNDAVLLARLEPVLARLRHDEANPVLDELAEIAGMGKYQLIRSMKRGTGLAPLAWRQNQRVIKARRMLREGSSLADTAHSLGFVDQSHFHRVFRAHVAASPGSYRAGGLENVQ